MVIENMRFTLQPDGKLDVKFHCCDCQEWVDKPAMLTNYNASILFTKFLCLECREKRRLKRKQEEEERLRNRTLWQKFKDFWF